MEVTDNSNFNKIGGFLLLPVAGLFLNIYSAIRAIGNDLFNGFINGGVAFLISVNSQYYDPRWIYVLIITLLMNLVIATFSIVLLILCFKKKSTFPKMIIIYFFLGIVISLIKMIFAIIMPVTSTYQNNCIISFIGSIVGAVIWTSYFSISKRVKAIFIK